MERKFTNANVNMDSATHTRSTVTQINMLILGGILSLLTSVNAQPLFDGYNGGPTLSRPVYQSGFDITDKAGWDVSQIATFHFNNGLGIPGVACTTVQVYGPVSGSFQACRQGGSFDYMAAVNRHLPAGHYTIADSHPDTWSWNDMRICNTPQRPCGIHTNGTYGAGFVRVFGSRTVAAPPPPPAPTPTPVRTSTPGSGTFHPDLRPYGGNGPFGTTNLSVNLPVPRILIFIEPLSAGTDPAGEAARCIRNHGTLRVIRDEPWFYAYGQLAIVACAQ